MVALRYTLPGRPLKMIPPISPEIAFVGTLQPTEKEKKMKTSKNQSSFFTLVLYPTK